MLHHSSANPPPPHRRRREVNMDDVSDDRPGVRPIDDGEVRFVADLQKLRLSEKQADTKKRKRSK